MGLLYTLETEGRKFSILRVGDYDSLQNGVQVVEVYPDGNEQELVTDPGVYNMDPGKFIAGAPGVNYQTTYNFPFAVLVGQPESGYAVLFSVVGEDGMTYDFTASVEKPDSLKVINRATGTPVVYNGWNLMDGPVFNAGIFLYQILGGAPHVGYLGKAYTYVPFRFKEPNYSKQANPVYISGRCVVLTDADCVSYQNKKLNKQIAVFATPNLLKHFIIEADGYLRFSQDMTFLHFEEMAEQFKEFSITKLHT